VAGRPAPAGTRGLHRSAATLLVTPAVPLPQRGDWTVLPLLGVRPPDSYGLGMFLTGGEWFTHIGGARSFISMLAGSASDGCGAVVMVAASSVRFLARLMTAVSDDEGWSGFRLRGPARLARFAGGLAGLR
jgi:hypothetical protein